jgi:hypothetical protein
MQIQRKKTNTRFIIITIIILIGVGLFSWWVVSWYLNFQQEETVSVEALIEEDSKIEEDSNNGNNVSENNINEDVQSNDVQKQDNEDNKNNKESADSVSEEQEDSEQLVPKDITIQVLNAGAPTGAAGTVTNKFDKKGYKTNSATNASHNYEGVVIYYSADKSAGLDGVVEVIGDTYGTPKQEESDTVTKKYNADIVVVIGS